MPTTDQGPTDARLDEVAFALERLCTYLIWIEEHRASFEATQGSDPAAALAELAHLADAILHAQQHAKQLATLLLSGQTIDDTRTLPRDLHRVIARLRVIPR